MREGEALGLTWDCVDFDKGTILINKQLQREKKKNARYLLVPTKNEKSRTITPAPWVMQLLLTHRARQNEQRLKAGPRWEDSGFVFTNEPSIPHLKSWCPLLVVQMPASMIFVTVMP